MYLIQTITLFLLAVLQCSGQSRVYGGDPAESGRFPYFTLVRTNRSVNGMMRTTTCGGSLITSDVILVGAV